MIFPSSADRLVSKLRPAWKLGNFPCPVTQYHLPVCLGPSALQRGTRTCLSFSVVSTGWFSTFLSSCMEELGLPTCSSCNTSFKGIYLAQLTISIKISFPPAVIAGSSSCFCREVDSDSLCPTLSHSQLNKVLVDIQFLTTVDLTTASPLISPSVVMGKIV